MSVVILRKYQLSLLSMDIIQGNTPLRKIYPHRIKGLRVSVVR